MARAVSLTRFGRSQGRLTVVKVAGGELVIRYGSIDKDDFATYLRNIGLRMQDIKPVLDKYGEYIVNEHILRQFVAQGTPRRWAPLSPAYARRKARRYPGRPILVRTTRMKRGFRWEARPRSLRVINRVMAGQKGRGRPRWHYHQEGTSKMPARPMLQFTDADRDRLHEFAEEHLREAVND
jgi:phage gpG-like protein